MNVEITRDKVHLGFEEIQDVIKAHVLKITGRTVDGSIVYPEHKSSSGYAYLKPVAESTN